MKRSCDSVEILSVIFLTTKSPAFRRERRASYVLLQKDRSGSEGSIPRAPGPCHGLAKPRPALLHRGRRGHRGQNRAAALGMLHACSSERTAFCDRFAEISFHFPINVKSPAYVSVNASGKPQAQWGRPDLGALLSDGDFQQNVHSPQGHGNRRLCHTFTWDLRLWVGPQIKVLRRLQRPKEGPL